MTTIPDWKLQLLARRRQEEAAVRGREKAERDRLSQMPAWKRGLLERRRAKLGLPSGEPSPVPGTAEAGPPDPDEPVVLMEAIGPVHQNRFIRQERQQLQQRNEELHSERKPGPLEAREWRSSPGDSRDQSPKGRDAKEERLSPREARERRLGVGKAQDSSPRPLEIRDWRPSTGEAGDRTLRLSEAEKWRLSPGETPDRSLRPTEPAEQSPGRDLAERRLSPEESGDQKLGLTEAHKWRPDPRGAQEQSSVQLQSSEWRLSSRQERKDCWEECGAKERPSPGTPLEESAELSETQARETGVEATEPASSPVADGEKGLRLTEGWKWTLNSGKAREWTLRDMETQPQQTESLESGEKPLGPPGVEAEGEAAKEEAGAPSRPLGALQNHSSVPSPLPPEDAGPARQLQEEEATGPQSPAAPLSPPPPAPSAPQPPGDPLMSRLFYGVKAGPGVGAPRRSGHTFTVNPRRSAPANPAPPATPATADAAATGAGKKRYPTAEEILVLGGYLRLSRSCLVKGSPERHHKQLKISFSETALETTYQYPSESSILEELGPEPEAPRAISPAPPDDEDEEEDLLLLQRELQGGLRSKALIVDESCRR